MLHHLTTRFTMPKFAANLSTMFADLPFIERFGAATAAGFDAVEFLFPYGLDPDQIVARLERFQLELVLFNMPPGDWAHGDRGMACDPRRIGEFEDGVKLALDYAQELGVRQLHCMAGKLHAAVTPERARETYVRNLRFAADTCAQHDITLLIEPINTFDIPGYFLTGTRQAVDIIADVAAPNLRLQYDIYHMQRMEGELATTLRVQLPLIGHIQLADVPGRHEPGTGEINFPFLFKLLDDIGYTGWIGCEYTPLNDTVAGLNWRP